MLEEVKSAGVEHAERIPLLVHDVDAVVTANALLNCSVDALLEAGSPPATLVVVGSDFADSIAEPVECTH